MKPVNQTIRFWKKCKISVTKNENEIIEQERLNFLLLINSMLLGVCPSVQSNEHPSTH